VLGSHGCTGLDRILMGSVSQQVVVQAKCPVLLIRHTLTETSSFRA
jgi:nucleotide-binding universal stress UspA family protein